MNGKRTVLIITIILLIFATCVNIMAKIVEGDKLTRLYVLKDPVTGCVRYVGKTVKPLEYRLASHIYDSKRVPHRHVCNWIKKLRRDGLTPIIEEIDSCTWLESQTRETHWIRFFKSCGCSLTNHTDGGEGALNIKKSDIQIERLKSSLRKHSKKVYQYDVLGNLLNVFENRFVAAEAMSCNALNIFQCCQGEKKSHSGYMWSWNSSKEAYSGRHKFQTV